MHECMLKTKYTRTTSAYKLIILTSHTDFISLSYTSLSLTLWNFWGYWTHPSVGEIFGSKWKHMACRAEIESLQYMSQSRTSMYGALLNVLDTLSCLQEMKRKWQADSKFVWTMIVLGEWRNHVPECLELQLWSYGDEKAFSHEQHTQGEASPISVDSRLRVY